MHPNPTSADAPTVLTITEVMDLLRIGRTKAYEQARLFLDTDAEIAGVSPDLLAAFSKRTEVIDAEMKNRLADFVDRNGRDPSIRERAAIERATAADTRNKKTDGTLRMSPSTM